MTQPEIYEGICPWCDAECRSSQRQGACFRIDCACGALALGASLPDYARIFREVFRIFGVEEGGPEAPEMLTSFWLDEVTDILKKVGIYAEPGYISGPETPSGRPITYWFKRFERGAAEQLYEARLARMVAQAEEAYTRMYEVHRGHHSCYDEASEALGKAIRFAKLLGRDDKAAELEKRREHIRSVYRSQFSDLG
jgi:hypothetical protein